MTEKRGHRRLLPSLPLAVRLTVKADEKIEALKVLNVSRSGASLLVPHPLPLGSELGIRIHLPLPHHTPALKGHATVRRCDEVPGHHDQKKQYRCGVSIAMPAEESHQLERFIDEVIANGWGVFDRRSVNRLKNGISLRNPAIYHSHQLSHEKSDIELFQLSMNDLENLYKVEVGAWGEEMCATKAMLQSRLEVFPEGMIGARRNGEIIGYVCVMMINSTLCEKDFTWAGISDGGYIRATHDPNGDCLYGVSLSVMPKAPKPVAVQLLKAAGKLSVRMALKGILFGCRIPNFHKHAKRMSAATYVKAKSRSGRILDPELSLYRQVNCVTLRVIPNYFEDPESLNNGVLVFFENPLYALQRKEYPFFLKTSRLNSPKGSL